MTTTTNHFSIFLLLIALFAPPLLLMRAWRTRWQRQQRLRFIEAFFSSGHLRTRIRERYPQLGDSDLTLIDKGLRQFFKVMLAADDQNVAMPSQAVDAMWHAFILDTRRYSHFCQAAFGHYLHHTPAESMRSPRQPTSGIRRAWQLCCADERLDPRRPSRLPLLFAIDAQLGIQDGFHYSVDCSKLQSGERAIYCGTDAGGGCGGGSADCDSSGSDGDGSGCGSGCGGGNGGGGGCGGD